MTYKEIVDKVASNNNFSKRFVDRVYRAYWKTIREHICELPLKEDLTDEEFLALRPNVNVPSLGKLCVTLERYKYIKNKHKQYSERYAAHKENKTSV